MEKIYIDDFVIDEKYHFLTDDEIPVSRAVCFDPLDLTKTILVLGKMGSGKSVFFNNILIQDWAYNRAIIHDLKGEYVEKFYREDKDIIFNIYDERSYLWDVWGDVKRNPALIKSIAKSIATAVSKEEDFWVNAAAKLLADAMMYSLQRDEGWDGVLKVIAKAKQKAEATNDKTMLSVLSTLSVVEDVFELMSYLEYKEVKKFSIYEFIEKRDKQKLFLMNNPAYQQALSPLFSAFLSALIQILLSRPDTKEDLTMLLLDEFLSLKLSQSDAVTLFTAIRSKGGQLLIGSQYLPTDNKDGWKLQLMLSSRHALFLFKVADQKTIEVLGKLVGTQEWIFNNVTISQSHSESSNAIGFDRRYTKSETTSTSTQLQRNEFLTPALLNIIPEYHHISFVESLIYLGYTHYINIPKRNETFVQRDLTEFWQYKAQTLENLLELEDDIGITEEVEEKGEAPKKLKDLDL
jgi:type IV secretory pathway TraG/TraD family ATPase VirD4